MAAAAESSEAICVDVTCGENTMALVVPTARRQTDRHQFRVTDLLYYGFSVSILIADVATDIIVFVEYLYNGMISQSHLVWGCLTMCFTILPACVTQLFSLRWHHSDGSLTAIHWLLHFLFLGLLYRYLTLFHAAIHSFKNKPNFSKDKSWVHRQESDVCMLYLFKSFMGAAPQLILQIYVIHTYVMWKLDTPVWISASAVTSCCSLTWAVGIYIKAMHNINRPRNHFDWITLIFQFLWRCCMLMSRIGALVLGAVFLKAWFFLFLGLHWLFMTIWVILQKTEFCPTIWEERIYNCIIGLIYCFDFFNLREGKSRYRMFAFYLVIAVQNLFLLTFYIFHFTDMSIDDIQTRMIIVFVVVGGMTTGLMMMLLYYQFHPSRMRANVCQNIGEHSQPTTIAADAPKSFKLFHRGSLASLHHSMDILPRITSEEVATDKQSLLTNIAQISDCVEEGMVNHNYNTSENESVRVSAECETSHNRAYKEEITLPKDNSDDDLSGSTALNSLYQALSDVDDAEAHQRQKRRGICLPIAHGLDIEKNMLSEDADACLTSRKRRGIYEHSITSQLDWLSPDITNIDLSFDSSERDNSLTLNSCSKVLGVLDAIKNRGRLMTPTQLESGRIFDIERVSKDLQRDETMSCVTSIHDYENVCPLGVARPPWCIRSWKGYTDIETYIHDDSVVRDRRRDTLTSTTGTTYSSEYSDGMCPASLITHGVLKQDDYADTSAYDLVESKKSESSPYNTSNDMFVATTHIDDRNATTLYIAKPVVLDDKGGMLALDTILEERDDSMSASATSEEDKFQNIESAGDSASTLVSTIDQIRRYTAENSPRHVYHTTGTQWEDLNPKNLMARTHFAKVLVDNDLGNSPTSNPGHLTASENSRAVDKREIEAIREFVKCCAIESIKKTPLIDAILSDSPILGSRGKLMRQVTFTDYKNGFDANESDLYVEMSPLVSAENSENPYARLTETTETEVSLQRDQAATISKKSPELSDKENLTPALSSRSRRSNNNDSNDRCAWTIERNDKFDRPLCNVRFNLRENLREKRHIFLQQVLSPPKLWNKRISFHPSTKNL